MRRRSRGSCLQLKMNICRRGIYHSAGDRNQSSWGSDGFDHTTPEEQQRRIEGGTEAFASMSGERQQDLINVGVKAFVNLSSDRQDARRKLGRIIAILEAKA